MIHHEPSEKHLDEMRAQAQIFRAALSNLVGTARDDYPVLILKCRTQRLRQITRGCRVHLQTARLNRHLLYAVRVFDDAASPEAFWSVVEGTDEIAALHKALLDGDECGLHLFNEMAINVASVRVRCYPNSDIANARKALDFSKFADRAAQDRFSGEAKSTLDNIQLHDWRPKHRVVDAPIVPTCSWDVSASFSVVGASGIRELSTLEDDPGTYLEQLIEVLAARHGSYAVYRSPRKKSDGDELCDCLVLGSNWAIVVQAKATDIEHEGEMANRERLMRREARNAKDAIRQARGASRLIRNGVAIISATGEEISLANIARVHGLAVVSDLSLFENGALGGEYLRAVESRYGVKIQIVDTIELGRLMTTERLFRQSGSDWLYEALSARWEGASKMDTPFFYI